MNNQLQFFTSIALSSNSGDIALLSSEIESPWSIQPIARPILSGLRVLVVDDDPDTRVLFAFALEAEGAQVFTAASTAKALAVFEQMNPDVLVSDIKLPDEDDYTLLQMIKALEAKSGKQTPAVAVTACCTENDRLQALSAGFQVYLLKPTDLDELVAVVRALAEQKQKT